MPKPKFAILVQFSETDYKMIDSLSKTNNINRTQVIREAVRAYHMLNSIAYKPIQVLDMDSGCLLESSWRNTLKDQQ